MTAAPRATKLGAKSLQPPHATHHQICHILVCLGSGHDSLSFQGSPQTPIPSPEATEIQQPLTISHL